MLRGRALGEADRVVTLFTAERGKLDAAAKGVRRANSRLAGRLEFGTECAFGMHRGRSLDVIVSAEILHAPWVRLVEPERYAAASLVAELMDAFCEPDLAMPDAYELLAGAIGAIERSDHPRDLLPRFELRLLDVLGIAPPADRCVRCETTLQAGPSWLDARSGGLVDAACRERRVDLPELDEEDRENLRALMAGKGAHAPAVRARPRVARAAGELLAHHLGRRPRAGSSPMDAAP